MISRFSKQPRNSDRILQSKRLRLSKTASRFKEALEKARLANYVEVGSNPELGQAAIVGMLYQFTGSI
jgi:hypothetical protein